MSYIDIKTIKGREYKYLRKSVREGKKMKKYNLKYIGPVEPVYKIKKMRKSNASIFVRSLIPDEVNHLKKATKSSKCFTRDRAKILLLSSQGYPSLEIVKRIDCDVRKVRNAIHGFNKNGFKALVRKKAKGAQPKFTKEQKAKILKAATTDPRVFNLPFTTWSLPKLKNYLADKNIAYISIERLRQILNVERIRLKKSKRHQYSNDPEFDKKNF